MYNWMGKRSCKPCKTISVANLITVIFTSGLTPLNRRSSQTMQGLYCLLNWARLPYP